MEIKRLCRSLFCGSIYGLGLIVACGAMVTAHAAGTPLPEPTHKPLHDPRPFSKPEHDGFVLVLWEQSYTDAQITAILQRIRATGAEMLEIPVFGCQSTIHSSDVADCPDNNRAYAMKLGKAAVLQGFSVTILPIVITPKWEWRGLFDPDDVGAWFQSYTTWMDLIAADSVSLGSPELIAGTEFKLLYKYPDNWKALLTHLRTVFPGPLVVTANWDDLNYSFWDETDAIGVSAYFPLSTQPDPSQSVLDGAWLSLQKKLLQTAKKWSRPLHFTEVGYTSSTAAAATPWTYTSTDTADPELQARCFDAFRKAWTGQNALVRANVWAVGDPDASDSAMGFDPLGKPAEAVLRLLFANRPF